MSWFSDMFGSSSDTPVDYSTHMSVEPTVDYSTQMSVEPPAETGGFWSGIGDAISGSGSGGSTQGWGDFIKPAITAGTTLFGGIMSQNQAEAQAGRQDAMSQQRFEAEMAYKYAALAQQAALAGSGGDPFAAEKMKLAKQQANDSMFAKKMETRQVGQKQTSESIRNFIQAYQNAYK